MPFGCHGASRRFNPALARATAIRSAIATTASFSIRPRARGRPFAVGQTNRQGLGFNPRPPRGGRRVSPNLWPMAARRFNPRPRAEATASSGRRRSAPVSIRPRAGGQPVASSRRLRSACSIHALARRHTIPAPAPEAKEFQSALAQEATALPLRRRWLPFNRPRAKGRPDRPRTAVVDNRFNRPRAKGRHRRRRPAGAGASGFNPRPRAEGNTRWRWAIQVGCSIPALARRATCVDCIGRRSARFQSTPSRGGDRRTGKLHFLVMVSITPSRRGRLMPAVIISVYARCFNPRPSRGRPWLAAPES